jgi:hypothetical protein
VEPLFALEESGEGNNKEGNKVYLADDTVCHLEHDSLDAR